MADKLFRIEPVLQVDGKLYKVCSLNVSEQKEEFIYHFAVPKGGKEQLFYINNNRMMGRPDHITYHKDGHVHLTLKKNAWLNEEVMPDDSFLPSNNETITPLLVHSIYPTPNGDYYLPVLDNSEIKPDLHKLNWWPQKIAFSVIIFLTPDKIACGDVLVKAGLGTMFGSHAGRIIAWDRWAIDYFLTDLTLALPPKCPALPCRAAFAYTDLDRVLGALLHQRTQLIQSFQNMPSKNEMS